MENKITPSGLRFEQGRGGVGWGQETAPPARVSGEGGVGWWWKTRDGPSDSRFERGRGRVRWWKTRSPPPACVSSKGGVGGLAACIVVVEPVWVAGYGAYRSSESHPPKTYKVRLGGIFNTTETLPHRVEKNCSKVFPSLRQGGRKLVTSSLPCRRN